MKKPLSSQHWDEAFSSDAQWWAIIDTAKTMECSASEQISRPLAFSICANMNLVSCSSSVYVNFLTSWEKKTKTRKHFFFFSDTGKAGARKNMRVPGLQWRVSHFRWAITWKTRVQDNQINSCQNYPWPPWPLASASFAVSAQRMTFMNNRLMTFKKELLWVIQPKRKQTGRDPEWQEQFPRTDWHTCHHLEVNSASLG